MFTGRRIVLDPNYLRSDLGYRQAFAPNGPRSYSQQGNFSSVRRSGQQLTATSPRAGAGRGTIQPRTWNIQNRLEIIVATGQSNGVGSTTDSEGVDDPIAVFTVRNPSPNLMCFVGGVSPKQGGTGIGSVDEVIDAAQYEAPLIPAKEGINTGRTPGREFTNEEWITGFGEVLASACKSGNNVVLVINTAVGGAVFNEVWIDPLFITSMTWLAGVATVTFTGPTNIVTGDKFWIKGANAATQDEWNGYWTATSSASSGQVITWSMPDTPTPYTTGATGASWGQAMANARTMVRYAVDTLAPAMGLTPHLAAVTCQGHESNTGIYTAASWEAAQWIYARDMADDLGSICGNTDGDPWIVWPLISYGIMDYESRAEVQNGVNPCSFGLLSVAANPANRLITCAQYSSVGGGDGGPTTAASHFGTQGHSDNGERAANLFLDAQEGITDTLCPPYITASSVVRVANSSNVTFTYNEPVFVDSAGIVSDPGSHGIQLFENAATLGGNLCETDVSSVTIASNGLDGTLTAASLPSPTGNYIGVAYMNAYTQTRNASLPIVSSTWAAGEATFVLTVDPQISVGDDVAIRSQYPVGYDVTGVAAAGTTGTTVKVALASDPGTLALSTATWTNGVATYTLAGGATHIMLPGCYVTVTGYATYTGYNVTQAVIRSVTSTTFSVVIYTNPGGSDSGGAVVGGGIFAGFGRYANGLYGNRSQIRAPEVTHYSHRSGVPYARWAAHQYLPVDVYTSTKDISAMLAELGMSSTFKLVHDYSNASCYSGSGTSVVNLGTSGATNNYTLGSGGNPTFNGSAGAGDRSNYFSAGGAGKFFSPTSTPDVLVNAHKIDGQFTMIVVGRMPASISANNWLLSTTDGTGPGVRLMLTSTSNVNCAVLGAAGATVANLPGSFLTGGDYFVCGVGVQNLNATSWSVGATSAATTFTTLNPVFASASSAAAQSTLYKWRNGSTGTVYVTSGMQEMACFVTDTFITQAQILPLIRSLVRRQMQNLP